MGDDKTCKKCLHWNPNQSSEPKDENGETLRICWNLKMGGIRDDDFGCAHFLGEHDPLLNLPDHTPYGIDMPQHKKLVDAPVEMFIVTYSKDFCWLEYCLMLIKKYCTGFQGVTVAHPNIEKELFSPLVERFLVRLHGYDEVNGKGMIQHMVKMAEADLIVPSSTKFVLHLDADCMFKMQVSPEHYFTNSRPDYLYRAWESLSKTDPHNPLGRVVSDCIQWRTPTDNQLGFNTEIFGMCRHPSVMPIGFYRPYRNYVAGVHGKSFEDYMMEGRNEFPQNRMDWTAMGAWAWKFMRDDFNWIDVEKPNYPIDRLRAYWSHGGITPEIREEIEGFLR